MAKASKIVLLSLQVVLDCLTAFLSTQNTGHHYYSDKLIFTLKAKTNTSMFRPLKKQKTPTKSLARFLQLS
jgi:hypothetical protein